VVGAADGTLEVAQHHIHPARRRLCAGRAAAAGVQRRVRVFGVLKSAKAGQTIGVDIGLQCQSSLNPVLQRGVVEGLDRLDHGERWMGVGLIGFHGNQERLLVLGTTSGFAAVAFTAKVGVVELDEAFEFSAVFPLSHCLHDFVLEPPGGAVAPPQMTGELQCGQVGLGRSEEVNRQKLGRQRQLGRFKQCAADQGGLMLTGPALIEDLPAPPEAQSAPVIACGAAKPLRPTCPIQRPAALGLGAVEADELGHRQTGLELNGVHGHGGMPPMETGANLRLQRLKSRDFRLRFDANQVESYSASDFAENKIS
jgi:hypothetical protein